MELTTKQEAQLAKDVKAGKNQSECAKNLGVTPGQLGMLPFCKAQVAAGIFTKAPATEASFKKLREAGNRWELIAARTGATVGAIKAAVGDGTYIGRGRKPGTASTSTKATGAKATGKLAGRGKTGVQPVSNKPARARTRAERAARSGNPS